MVLKDSSPFLGWWRPVQRYEWGALSPYRPEQASRRGASSVNGDKAATRRSPRVGEVNSVCPHLGHVNGLLFHGLMQHGAIILTNAIKLINTAKTSCKTQKSSGKGKYGMREWVGRAYVLPHDTSSPPSARTSAPASRTQAEPSLTAATVSPAPELPRPVVTTDLWLIFEANFMI